MRKRALLSCDPWPYRSAPDSLNIIQNNSIHECLNGTNNCLSWMHADMTTQNAQTHVFAKTIHVKSGPAATHTLMNAHLNTRPY